MNAGAVEQGRHTAPAEPWDGLEGRERHAAALRAARAGDKAAFDVLMKDLSPLVWHVARSAGLGPEQAEDVAQTVWLALLRHLHQLTEPRALSGWLLTTTRREAYRVQRRATIAGSQALDEASERIVDESPQPEEHVLRSERDRRLWAAFHQLSQREQDLLRFTVLASRAEYRAVAEALQMPHGSIGPTRGRALNRLRQLYDETGDESNLRYVPVSEPLRPTATAAALSLWRLGTNELVMPVYTSEGGLHQALGANHPWVAVRGDRLPDLLAATPADRFVWDSAPATVRAAAESVIVDRRAVLMIGSVAPRTAMPTPEPPKPAVGERDALVVELQGLILRGRPPSGPITDPWTLSYNGMGEIRIAPSEIVFDGDSVPWNRVTEVRARRITDYVNADALRLQIDDAELREAVLTVVIAIVEQQMNRVDTDLWIPAEIEYTDHLARRRTLHAGALTALFLADPGIRASVLATARTHGISSPTAVSGEFAAHRELEALQRELAKLHEHS